MTEIIAVPSRRAPAGAVKMQLSIIDAKKQQYYYTYTKRNKAKKRACALRLFLLLKNLFETTRH